MITRLILMIMTLTPYGVFCLMAKLFAHEGVDLIMHLLSYFVLVLLVLGFHLLVVYPSILYGFTGIKPWQFFSKLYPAMVVAFSVASSNVSLPVTLQTVKKRLGVSGSIANFVVPLGTTVNMDGTAMMQGLPLSCLLIFTRSI